MTGTSILEVAAALHGHYVQASKLEKGRLLDECSISGFDGKGKGEKTKKKGEMRD